LKTFLVFITIITTVIIGIFLIGFIGFSYPFSYGSFIFLSIIFFFLYYSWKNKGAERNSPPDQYVKFLNYKMIKILLFLVLFVYHCFIILFTSSVILDTPQTIKNNQEAGFGPNSGFALMFLVLSGVGPVGAILLAWASYSLLYKKILKLHKKLKGFLVFITLHIVTLLLLWLRIQWVFNQ
jgi:hypothetical protein